MDCGRRGEKGGVREWGLGEARLVLLHRAYARLFCQNRELVEETEHGEGL